MANVMCFFFGMGYDVQASKVFVLQGTLNFELKLMNISIVDIPTQILLTILLSNEHSDVN